MLSKLPGFRSHGSPAKQMAAEERAHRRRVRDEYDDSYQDAMRRHESRHPAVRAMDEMVTADDPADWDPDRNDYAGVDTRPGYAHGGRGRTMWERIEDVSTI